MTRLRTVIVAIFALAAGSATLADAPRLTKDSTIIVSADESWEDAEEDIIHFRGNFELRTPDWAVMADEATVFGELDDPTRVVAEGLPVQFVFRKSAAEPDTETHGEGQLLEYDRVGEILSLTGNAKLTNGERIMQSSEIRYDLERQKLKAGGAEGVQITVGTAQENQ